MLGGGRCVLQAAVSKEVRREEDQYKKQDRWQHKRTLSSRNLVYEHGEQSKSTLTRSTFESELALALIHAG